MEEIWKDIEGYQGIYQVSNLGRIRSLDRFVEGRKGSRKPVKGQIIKEFITKFGYCRVNLWTKQHYKTYFVHRLVYSTFVGPIPEGMQVNHIDENKTNNRLNNLNLMTPQENNNWGTHNERCQKGREGFKMPEKAKLKIKKKNSIPIIQMDLEGNELMGWFSATDCQKETDFNQSLINRVCKGVYKQAYGYKWKYAV